MSPAKMKPFCIMKKHPEINRQGLFSIMKIWPMSIASGGSELHLAVWENPIFRFNPI
uniref:Uncharacterized protein n=1 Tax=Anguilla anguilla TaxID=7936 RepID=A0A0E9TSW7_ANGAN